MPRVRLFHWKSSEAQSLVDLLRSGGYDVEYPGENHSSQFRSLATHPAHAAVIDLTYKPAHGRYVGLAIRSRKNLKALPLIYVDGAPEKVERVRGELPDATFVTRAKLLAALKKAKPAVDPVSVPMPTYANRTTAQKMGIEAEAPVGMFDPPADYEEILGSAHYTENKIQKLNIWFVQDPDGYLSVLPKMRRVAERGRLWIVWPKGGVTGITQNLVRAAALEMGLVDYKICSVSERWSGMLFTVNKRQ